MSQLAPISKPQQKREPIWSPKHTAFIRQQPCLRCRFTVSECHHLRAVPYDFKNRAMGATNDDVWGVPLCSDCHQWGNEPVHSVGTKKELLWFRIHCEIDPVLMALCFATCSPDPKVRDEARIRMTSYLNIEEAA